MLHINHSIDWLQATSHSIKYPEQITPVWFDIGENIRPFPRYEFAQALEPCGRLDWTTDEHIGAMFTLTGKDMMHLRTDERKLPALIDHLITYGCKFPRIDFCADIVDDEPGETSPRLSDVTEAIKNGSTHGLKPSRGVHSYTGGGDTEYFGAEGSKRRIYIYDKAREQKLLALAWLRVELRSRGKPANMIVHDMHKQGISKVGRTKIKELLQLPGVSWFDLMLAGDYAQLTREQKLPSKFWDWLEKQVKPAMQKKMSDKDENDRLLDWLNGMVMEATRAQFVGRKRRGTRA